jgi:hypothetical protein
MDRIPLQMADRKTPLRADPRFQSRDDLPGWLRTLVDAHITLWETHRATTCMHSPTRGNAVPAHMAAWRPELVTCPGCTHLAVLRRDDPQVHACTCCRRITVGTEEDRTHGVLVHLPGITYALALCVACRAGMN